jgi:hypothetical protein
LFAAGLSLIIVQRTKRFYSQLYGKSLSWVRGRRGIFILWLLGGWNKLHQQGLNIM